MQTFLPVPDCLDSARILDKRRCWKQVVETSQILKILLAERAGLVQVGKLPWANHPAVRMWRGFESFLVCYYNVFWTYCVEVHKIKVSKLQKKENLFGATPNPEWFGDERLHASHRSNLLRKNKEFYSKYNWLEDDSLPYFWPK